MLTEQLERMTLSETKDTTNNNVTLTKTIQPIDRYLRAFYRNPSRYQTSLWTSLQKAHNEEESHILINHPLKYGVSTLLELYITYLLCEKSNQHVLWIANNSIRQANVVQERIHHHLSYHAAVKASRSGIIQLNNNNTIQFACDHKKGMTCNVIVLDRLDNIHAVTILNVVSPIINCVGMTLIAAQRTKKGESIQYGDDALKSIMLSGNFDTTNDIQIPLSNTTNNNNNNPPSLETLDSDMSQT